ncbi:MAG: hypothetical protein KJ574_04515, partial [Nanoarchaeota archaeon]|nr:hypothetical protein [Nanoarchaeota archaeon]
VDTSNISCNVSITDIAFDRFVYNEKEKISYDIQLNDETFPFVIRYSITDLFDNFAKKETLTTNTNKKSFTPSGLKESDKVYMINAEVTPSCNDVNLSDNNRSEFLVVKKTGEQSASSSMIIKSIATKEPKFGSDVLVNLVIYKGDTRKVAINLFAETAAGKRISQITKIHVNDKFTNYDFNIPVLLNKNCDKKYKEGSYFIVAEGLDIKERYRFNIVGWSKDCVEKEEANKTSTAKNATKAKKETSESKSKEDTKSTTAKPELKSNTNSSRYVKSAANFSADRITGMTVYKSSSLKSKEFLPLLFFAASALLSVIVILKRL